MTSIEFKSWLLGFLEDKNDLTIEQIDIVRDKIKNIQEPIRFNPIVPLHPTPTPTAPFDPFNPYPTGPGDFPPYSPITGPDVWYTTSSSTNNFNVDEKMDTENNKSEEETDD